MMDKVMQLHGPHYLRATLKPVLDLIITERKNCEIDPTRVKDKAQIDLNFANLKVGNHPEQKKNQNKILKSFKNSEK